MSHIESLEFMTLFNTQGQAYKPRRILPAREEIELILSGRANLSIGDQTLNLHAGDLVWHKSGDLTVHSNTNHDDYECLFISFAVSRIQSPTARARHWLGKISARQFAEDALSQLPSHQNEPDFAEYLYSACKIHTQPIVIRDSNLTFSADQAFDNAIQIIAEHFHKSAFNVATLAEAVHVSSSSLHQIFKTRTGRTPHQKILQFRMEHASALLKENRPLKQISSLCGFESESGFHRAFKKYYHCNPNHFRRQNKADSQRMIQPEYKVIRRPA